MENYQSYLVAYCAVMVFESYEIHFFSFCHSYLDLSHDFLAHICFHSHLTLRILLLAIEDDAVNDVQFAPLSNYRERERQQADWHIKQNAIAHQSGVLAPR